VDHVGHKEGHRLQPVAVVYAVHHKEQKVDYVGQKEGDVSQPGIHYKVQKVGHIQRYLCHVVT